MKNMFNNSKHRIHNKLLIIILILHTAFMVLSSWKSQYKSVHPFDLKNVEQHQLPCLPILRPSQPTCGRQTVCWLLFNLHSPSPFSIYSTQKAKGDAQFTIPQSVKGLDLRSHAL